MNEPYYKEIENKMNISHNQLDQVINDLIDVNKNLEEFQVQEIKMEEKTLLTQQINHLKQEIENNKLEFDRKYTNLQKKCQEDQLIHAASLAELKNQIQLLEQTRKEEIQELQQKHQLEINEIKSQFQTKNNQDNNKNAFMQENSDEFTILKHKYQQQVVYNEEREEVNQAQILRLKESLNQKTSELIEVKQLAQYIIDQRKQIEDFIGECLQKIEKGDDLQIKTMSQQQKMKILREILLQFK